MSHGLGFLYKLDLAKEYEAQREVLITAKRSYTSSMLPAYLLSDVTMTHDMIPTPLTTLSSWTTQMFTLQLGDTRFHANSPTPFGLAIDGLDCPPFHIWKKVHENMNIRHSVYEDSTTTMRECGYVMWDFPVTSMEVILERLDQLRVSDYGVRNTSSMEERDMVQYSLTERADIFDKGGRGYWSPGDLSRVIWP